VLYQAHAQPVLTGDLKPVKVKGGPTNIIGLEPEGSFKYETPGADIAGAIEWLKKVINEIFAIGGVPTSVVYGGSANSGFQIVVEYKRAQDIIDDAIVEATMFEKELAKLVCIVNNVHVSEIEGAIELPSDPDVSIEFDPGLIPRDEAAEREQDRTDLRDSLMSRKDYVRKWRMPDADDEAIDAYLAELQAEKPALPEPGSSPFGAGLGGLL
jgi:hypothetical protein